MGSLEPPSLVGHSKDTQDAPKIHRGHPKDTGCLKKKGDLEFGQQILKHKISLFEHHFWHHFDHTNFVLQKQIIPFSKSSGDADFKNGIIYFST